MITLFKKKQYFEFQKSSSFRWQNSRNSRQPVRSHTTGLKIFIEQKEQDGGILDKLDMFN